MTPLPFSAADGCRCAPLGLADGAAPPAARCAQEIIILESLNHPNVIHFYEYYVSAPPHRRLPIPTAHSPR